VFGFRNLGRRLVESVVGLFAVLGFVYVPLGQHTGFEHARAVLSTPAAAAAIDDLTTTALGLRQRVIDFISGRLSAPTGNMAEAPKAHPVSAQPRPVPPKLK
jgi:hypothetical protein